MADDKLTPGDKAILLGIMDGEKRDDYDEEFYKLLLITEHTDLKDVDGRIRRALLKYTAEFTDGLLKDKRAEDLDLSNAIAVSLLTGLLQGYELGRKRRRPLIAKPKL